MTNSIIVPFNIRNDMDIDKQIHKNNHDIKRMQKNTIKWREKILYFVKKRLENLCDSPGHWNLEFEFVTHSGVKDQILREYTLILLYKRKTHTHTHFLEKQNVSVDMDIHPCGCISIIDLFTRSPIIPILAFDPEFLYWIFLLNRPPSLPSHTQILALSVTLQQQWLQLDRYFFGLRMTCNMSYIMYYNPYSPRSARPFVLFYVCHNLRVFSSFFLPWFVSSNHFQLNKVFDNGCSSKYIIVISKV